MNETEIIIQGNPTDHIVGLTKPSIDRILKLEEPGDCLALYTFYCYTAKWQRTQTIKATNAFAAKALGWSPRFVSTRRQKLEEIGLIRSVSAKKNGKVIGWYIRVNFVFLIHQSAQNDTLEVQNQNANEPHVDGLLTNALETGSTKCPKTNTRCLFEGILAGQLARIYVIFHRKAATPLGGTPTTGEKGAWRKLTNKETRPLDDDELIMVERFYKKHWPPNRDKNNLRHALESFLNNFNGEVDKARQWCEKFPLPSMRRVARSTTPAAPEVRKPPTAEELETEAAFLRDYQRNHDGRLPFGWSEDDGKFVFTPQQQNGDKEHAAT